MVNFIKNKMDLLGCKVFYGRKTVATAGNAATGNIAAHVLVQSLLVTTLLPFYAIWIKMMHTLFLFSQFKRFNITNISQNAILH